MSRFNTELKRTLPDLWRYAFALCNDRNRADDMVQDCAEKAIRKQKQWKKDRPLKPWLMTMLLNIFRNQYRRDTYLRLVPIDNGRLDIAEPAHAEHRAELAATARNINQLPPEQREALLTVVVGGLDYGQAARTLDIPRGTLMSRISRAREKLRKLRGDDVHALRSIK